MIPGRGENWKSRLHTWRVVRLRRRRRRSPERALTGHWRPAPSGRSNCGCNRRCFHPSVETALTWGDLTGRSHPRIDQKKIPEKSFASQEIGMEKVLTVRQDRWSSIALKASSCKLLLALNQFRPSWATPCNLLTLPESRTPCVAACNINAEPEASMPATARPEMRL